MSRTKSSATDRIVAPVKPRRRAPRRGVADKTENGVNDTTVPPCADHTAAPSEYVCNSTLHTYTEHVTPVRIVSMSDVEKRRDVLCWHCAHHFDNMPIMIPKSVWHTPDVDKYEYICYGNFCSVSCAKTYLLDRNDFSVGHSLMLLARVARDVYRINDDICCAPPRVLLTAFGGNLTIDEFRRHNTDTTHTFVIEDERMTSNTSIMRMGPCSMRSVTNTMTSNDATPRRVVADRSSHRDDKTTSCPQSKGDHGITPQHPPAPAVDPVDSANWSVLNIKRPTPATSRTHPTDDQTRDGSPSVRPPQASSTRQTRGLARFVES